MPLKAEAILAHPRIQHAVWDLKPTSTGKVSVAEKRGGPFDIAYEVHGTGATKLVWIVGLGAFKWFWQRQTKDFGNAESSQYTCLTFDNRGMGESDKPLFLYSTKAMAKDVIELLEHLEWVEERKVGKEAERKVHVIGISIGGMTAQELVRHVKKILLGQHGILSIPAASHVIHGVSACPDVHHRRADALQKIRQALIDSRQGRPGQID
ncbi:hypothetical protein MMC13_006332 [Lambiella insularis]|nr:hypothetical protein [Lambiella insularis]